MFSFYKTHNIVLCILLANYLAISKDQKKVKKAIVIFCLEIFLSNWLFRPITNYPNITIILKIIIKLLKIFK